MKENTNRIDEQLENPAQLGVARIVAALADETPSMVWRSGLNESLRVEASRIRRRQRVFWFARPIAGLGLACALGVIAVTSLHGAGGSSSRVMGPSHSYTQLEASLVDLHRSEIGMADVAGTGLNPAESESGSVHTAASTASDDTETDLEY